MSDPPILISNTPLVHRIVDERLTAALIDRLTYHAHVFEFRGQSYRFRDHSARRSEVLTMT